MADCMNFPKNPMEFVNSYSFKDSEEVYTNGSNLIPVFRVEQMLEHYYPKKPTNADRIRSMSDEELAELFTIWSCEDADYTTLLDIEDCKWGTKQEVISRNLKWLQSEAE